MAQIQESGARAKVAYALLAAYPDRSALRELVADGLGTSLEEISSNATTLPDVVFRLLAWAEANGRFDELIVAARQRNPHNLELRALVDRFAGPPARTQDIPSDIPGEDPYDALIVGGGKPFIGRVVLRMHLRALAREQDRRVLVVNGPNGAGKSYTLQLISHVSNVLRTFKFAAVNLEEEAYVTLGPSELARALATQMGRSPYSLPADGAESSARHVLHLRDWLFHEISQLPTAWWVVLDGFDHPDVALETVDFIRSLVLGAAGERYGALRLVLLGCPDLVIPPSVEPSILRETLQPLGAQDVAQYFNQIADSGILPIRPEQVPQIVEVVMRLGTQPSALNLAVARTLRLLQEGNN